MELVKLTLKQHPMTAWAFIAFTAITAAAVAIHNIMAVLQDFHLIEK